MKAVFVGSSVAAVKYAKAVCKHLQSLGITPLPWWQQFPPGSVTLEAIEGVLEQVSGAVLLATPDDVRIIKGASQFVSRDNVILELGMFTARLGRRNVALLKYGDVVLPTDLSGFTHVKMGPFEPDKDVRTISAAARLHLEKWASGLQRRTEGIPHTIVVHGFTGRWHVTGTFSRWWDRPVVAPDYVNMDGEANIFLPLNGTAGTGSMVSIIDAVVASPLSSTRVKSVQTIEQVTCDASGNLRMVNQLFNRELLDSTGEVPQEMGYMPKTVGPVRYSTVFSPLPDEPRILTGATILSVAGRTLMEGEFRIEKLD